jgi:hypothetical protein
MDSKCKSKKMIPGAHKILPGFYWYSKTFSHVFAILPCEVSKASSRNHLLPGEKRGALNDEIYRPMENAGH